MWQKLVLYYVPKFWYLERNKDFIYETTLKDFHDSNNWQIDAFGLWNPKLKSPPTLDHPNLKKKN